MRLIDADALVADDRPGFNKFFSADDIRTAPTVCCGECRHNDPVDLGTWCLRHEFAIPGDDFGCAYFERREP